MNNPPNELLIIITDFCLGNPSSAGYNRVMCYAKALSLVSVSVIIVSSRYCYKSGFHYKNRDDEILILIGKEKTHYKTTFEDFHFLRIWKFIKESGKIIEGLGKNNSKRRYLLYNSTLANIILYLIFYKIVKKEKIFLEKNELKTAIALNRPVKSDSLLESLMLILIKLLVLLPSIISDFIAIFFNGLIVISTPLQKLYNPFRITLIRIPILANAQRTDIGHIDKKQKQKMAFKIGYFGIISEKKDGLFSLIDSIISLNDKNIELSIYGTGNKYFLEKLKKFTVESNRIKYCGLIESTQINMKLIEFDLLAFPRPSNLQTRFGFSTKLAEFLMSGVPVLTTDVSDNAVYLTDNYNAFVIKSTKTISQEILSQKILFIINMKENELYQVGRNGYNTAINNFHPYHFSGVLKDFFFNLYNSA